MDCNPPMEKSIVARRMHCFEVSAPARRRAHRCTMQPCFTVIDRVCSLRFICRNVYSQTNTRQRVITDNRICKNSVPPCPRPSNHSYCLFYFRSPHAESPKLLSFATCERDQGQNVVSLGWRKRLAREEKVIQAPIVVSRRQPRCPSSKGRRSLPRRIRRFPRAAALAIIGRDLDGSHPSPGNDPSSDRAPILSRVSHAEGRSLPGVDFSELPSPHEITRGERSESS